MRPLQASLSSVRAWAQAAAGRSAAHPSRSPTVYLSPISASQCRSRGRVERQLERRLDRWLERQPDSRHTALRPSAAVSAEVGTPREEGGKEGGAQSQRRRSLGEELLEKADQVADEDAFSFPLAVLLAGCAFEAYKEPVAGPGESSPFQYCERAVNGTRTVYVDRCDAPPVCPKCKLP